MDKKLERLRRAKKSRSTIKRLNKTRLCVHRSRQHIYAQIISPNGDIVITSASTLDKDIRDTMNGGNIEAAKKVGEIIASRARNAGIEQVAFDRSGFKYHGRIKALADAAREGGLNF